MISAIKENSQTKNTLVYVLILFFGSILLYIPSLDNDFVWDAKGVFLHDPSVRSIANIPGFFTEPSPLPGPADATGMFPANLKYYRPIMKTIHTLEHVVFGEHPLGYNAVNIVCNAVSVLLAFLLVNALTGSGTLAFLASLLYAVNPLRVEVVSWAYSDSYIFTAIFSFLSMYSYHCGHRFLSAGIYTIALFTHETAFLMPIIVLLYEVLNRKARTARELLQTAPFFLILIAFIVLRSFVVGITPLAHPNGFDFVNTAVVIIKRYLKLFIVPDAPITVYTYTNGMFAGLSLEVIVSYATVLLLVAFGVYLWMRRRDLFLWYSWFFVYAALTLNIGQFGEYLMAEKLLFMASLGLCVVLARLLLTQQRNVWVMIFFVILTTYHIGTTLHRQQYWNNTITYLEEALTFAPDFALGRWALADEYRSRHEFDRSLAEYQRTLALRPAYGQALRDRIADTHYLKGNDLSGIGNYDEALKEYQAALAWKPDHSLSHNNIGNIYLLQGQQNKAIEAWKKAIKADPSNSMAYYNIGMEHQKKGDGRSALAYYREYLARDKDPMPSVRALVTQLERTFAK